MREWTVDQSVHSRLKPVRFPVFYESQRDDLKRWENTHPEYNSFKEESDSQRQQNLSNS